MRSAALILAVLMPCTALAADDGDPVARVLLRAKSAFEYRDFARVIKILDPWVHPPRIADPVRMLEARRLLGISLHVEGKSEPAREEFGQILMAEPDHQLDPFVVPPAVIEAFEDVRTKMKPVLDRIRAERRRQAGLPLEPEPPSGAPHPIVAYLPFGLGQMIALDQVEWGAAWLAVQVIGLATNIVGYWLAEQLKNDDGFLEPQNQDAYDQRLAIQYGGVALFGAAWLTSGIQGHVSIEQRAPIGTPAGGATVGISIPIP